MNKTLLNKRCLIKIVSKWGGGNVIEVKVIEYSPSGGWIKLQNQYGKKHWAIAGDVSIVEVLEDINQKPLI